ncbi:unnamed protein product, partial [Closterium sp. Naga37s-1]
SAHERTAGALNAALPASLPVYLQGSSDLPTNNAVFRVFSPFKYSPLYTSIAVGSPARAVVVLVDTLSSLSWLLCHCAPSSYPAPSDILQNRTVFEPSSSATSRPVPCNSPSCPQASMFSCNSSSSSSSTGAAPTPSTPLSSSPASAPAAPPAAAAAATATAGGVCTFNPTSGSAAGGSAGPLISDLLSLLSTNSSLRRARVTFGCSGSSSSDPATDIGVDGVLALGARAFSIPAQLASPTAAISAPAPLPGGSAMTTASLLSLAVGAAAGGAAAGQAIPSAEAAASTAAEAASPPLPLSFSLCFDSGTAQGALVLGDPPHPGKLKTTSFMLAANSSRYYLNVTQVRVGSTPLPASAALGSIRADARGGVVVDTTFPYLALRPPLLQQLVDLVFSQPQLVRQDVDGFACASVPISKATNETFPPVVLEFPDTSYYVHPSTYLMLDGATAANLLLCLAAVPLPDDSVHDAYLGTQWLADHYLWFDLTSQKMHFRSLNCTTWDYLNSTLPPTPPPAAAPSTAPAPSPLIQPPATAPAEPPATAPTQPFASPPTQPPAISPTQPPTPNLTQPPATPPNQPPAIPPSSPASPAPSASAPSLQSSAPLLSPPTSPPQPSLSSGGGSSNDGSGGSNNSVGSSSGSNSTGTTKS